MEYEGKKYRSSKGVEWMKLQSLPSRVKWEMTLGMAGMPGDVSKQFSRMVGKPSTRKCRSDDPADHAEFIARLGR